MRYARCERIGIGMAAGVCVAAAAVWMAGCETKPSKRGALSELEIKRLTLAQTPDRPDRLTVCGETITWEDVLGTLPDEAALTPPLKEKLEKTAQEMSLRQFMEVHRTAVHLRLNNKIESIVLARRAERELGKKTDDKLNQKLEDFAKTELRRFILEEHGGNAAEAEEALQKMGMTRVSYLQWKKKQMLARHLLQSKFLRNRPITFNEISARYEEIKDSKFAREGTLQWRLIELHADKVAVKYPQEDAALKARQLAEDLRKRIDAGEDFAELAKKNSDGLHSEEGGLWRPRDPIALAAPYDALAKKAMSMEAGQVAGPLETTGGSSS
jgi:peptidyl-prolyl cis-trans isomerase SurA